MTPRVTPTVSSRRLIPLNRSQAVGQIRRRDADESADGDGSERIAHVVHTEQRRLEPAERLALPRRTEKRVMPSPCWRSCACHVLPSANPNVSTGLTAASRSRERMRAVGAEQQQAVARDQIDQAPERQPHGVEIRIDVGVVELDVVDHGHVGQVLQELGRLVEERTVVLVTLDARSPGRRPCGSSILRSRS